MGMVVAGRMLWWGMWGGGGFRRGGFFWNFGDLVINKYRVEQNQECRKGGK